MGTRHITAVYLDNEFQVAQYGQWDGYPQYTGVKILEFLKNLPSDFRERVRASHFLTDEEIGEAWVKAGADPDSQWVSMEVSDRFKEMYPSLHRDTGWEVLTMLPAPLADSIDFTKDGLFCEWTYVIDLDANRFEVYEGSTEPVEGSRFSNQILQASWPLDDLPSEDDFLHMVLPVEGAA